MSGSGANEKGSQGADGTITAAVLVIGDEILSGRTADVNINHIASQLTAVGITLTEARIVSDDEAAIVDALGALRARNTYVFTTGGIGPTHDDITADSVGAAFGVPVDIDPRAVELMRPYAEARGFAMEGVRMRMARIPQGAELVANAVSAAPGFWIGNVIVMAGVPKIMQAMLAAVLPKLRTGAPVLSVAVDFQHPESAVAEALSAMQAAEPTVSLGSYPYASDGSFCTQIVARSTDADKLQAVETRLQALLAELDGNAAT